MAKITFNTTDQGAWVEIEQPDGTMKRWDEGLTPDEYTQIMAAGMLMQCATLAHTALSSIYFNENTPKRFTEIKKCLDRAEMLIRKVFKGNS